MKALSIRQPWAWLIVEGYKDVENRNWRHSYTGPVAIHASKAFDEAGYEWVRVNFPEIPMPSRAGFHRGGVVGQALVTGCLIESTSPWFFGPYGYVLSEAERVPFVGMRGRLGFFEAPEISGYPEGLSGKTTEGSQAGVVPRPASEAA